MTLRPCLTCGEPVQASYCPEHQPSKPSGRNKPAPSKIGYGFTWRKLSERARRLQPWCSDCGTTEDLTCDHSREAWERFEQGKTIRLIDVDVLCRRCNALKGKQRPGGIPREGDESSPACKAQTPSHTPGGIG